MNKKQASISRNKSPGVKQPMAPKRPATGFEEADPLGNVLNDLGEQEGADAIDPDQFLLGGATIN